MKKKLALKRKFTLIELLTVISIVVILAALLLPALTRARARARLMLCVSNMRQVGLVVPMYAHDNVGVLPAAIGNYKDVFNLFESYSSDREDAIYQCPTASGMLPVAQRDATAAFNDFFRCGTAAEAEVRRNYASNRIAGVYDASRFMMFADAGKYEGAWGGSWRGNVGPGAHSYIAFPHDGKLAPVTGYTDQWWLPDGKAVFVYLDGHVEVEKKKEYHLSWPADPVNAFPFWWGSKNKPW